jgi:predicted ATP-grasp superfamily ATP-dependent carboligase/protein-tyrosine-phosphatase
MKVLVTDGHERSALAITRSLGKRGISVIVGEDTPINLSSCSRWCASALIYPSPRHDAQAFERYLLAFVEREHIDVILPVTDVTTHAVARNQETLARRTALAVPPFRAFERVTEKATLVESARACGIAVPATAGVNNLSDVYAIAGTLTYPVVIKPSRSRIRTDNGWVPTSVHYASSDEELLRLYLSIDYLAATPSLVQQRIVGPGEGLFALFDRGRLLTTFAHRRLREKPPSGGVSVLSESIPVDPELRDAAVRLLSPLGWHGVAMLEYKRDARNQQPFLMEVNGRFWGSLQLAVEAGVDFPYYAYQLALGRTPDVPRSYRAGVKSRWLLGDVDHLLLRLRKSNEALNLPPASPSRSRVVRDFLKVAQPGLRYDVASARDLAPFIYEITQYVRDLMKMDMTAPARPGLIRFSWDLACAFAAAIRRRTTASLHGWIAAWQMMRVRRNPRRLLSTLRSANTVLVVCQGNIIRSPFAARLVAHAAGERRHLSVRSGGLAAVAGKPSHPSAVLTATKQRIDLTDHHAAPLDAHVVRASDVIFVMELCHLLEMRRRFPEAARKTFLLTCLAAETPLEIQDPYNGDLSRFEACFDHIARAVHPIARTLTNSAA